MKSKNFNSIKPYTYLITRISDGLKYHGVRWENVRLKRTAKKDFGNHYFSSGLFKKEIKRNPKNFKLQLKWVFDTKEEAIKYELFINKKLIKKDKGWANRVAYPQRVNTPEQRLASSIRIKKKSPMDYPSAKRIHSALMKNPDYNPSSRMKKLGTLSNDERERRRRTRIKTNKTMWSKPGFREKTTSRLKKKWNSAWGKLRKKQISLENRLRNKNLKPAEINEINIKLKKLKNLS